MARDSERLIVALDVPTVPQADAIVEELGTAVGFYKVGLELILRGGLAYVDQLKRRRKRVFLDMKLLDISNTVERAVANAAELDVDFLTIHGQDTKTMASAVKGKGTSGLRILAVTVLTHLNKHDLVDHLLSIEPSELVVHRAKLARDAGCDGVIASPLEASRIRQEVGDGFLIVTPGIRLPSDDAGDQARASTPEAAIKAGADYLVVGRPITTATDPKKTALDFAQRIGR